MNDPAPGRPKPTDEVTTRPLLRRHLALVVATAALVTVAAFGFAERQQPTYSAQASVLIEPFTLPNAANPAPDMGTEQAIASSGVVLGNAAHALGVSVDKVTSSAAISMSTNADVLDFGYSAPTGAQAARGATALAAAYMAYRATTPVTADPKANVTQTLATPRVKTRMISSAAVPGSPSSPDLVIILIAGAVVGVLAGLGAALCADRFGRRLRTAIRWQEATGVPVLAGLPRGAALDRPESLRSRDDAMALRYLRLRVTQSVPRGGAVLLVTEVRPGVDGSMVARLLVGELRHAGWTATLVEIGREDADATAAPTAGSTAPGEQLARIDSLRGSNDLVVVAGPPVTASITTLDVAGVADAAVVVDSVRTARRDPARRVLAELRANRCRIAGAVLLDLPSAWTGDATTIAAPAPTPAAGPHTRLRVARTPRPSTRRPSALLAWTDLDAAVAEPAHPRVNGA